MRESVCDATNKLPLASSLADFFSLLGSGNSLGQQFGDNHKVKLGRKRSKTNGVKLGGMASGWWVSPGAPRCYPLIAQVLLKKFTKDEGLFIRRGAVTGLGLSLIHI